MTNNVVHFLWSAAIGDLSVTGSADHSLKRYSHIYIITSTEYFLPHFLRNPIFVHACIHQLTKPNNDPINLNQILRILIYTHSLIELLKTSFNSIT